MIGNFKEVTEVPQNRFADSPLGQQLRRFDVLDVDDSVVDRSLGETWDCDNPATITLDDETAIEAPDPKVYNIESPADADAASNTESLPANDVEESEYPSTYKERLDRTPSEKSDRGEWTGERGESTFIPSDEKMRQLLAQYGLEGITYKDGIPDFSECSECTVEIDNMTDKRYGEGGNFAQCDEKCAEQWNKEGRDGKTDWTARDVKEWREENGYTWHERNDMKTCDLVPTEINDYFGHLGGVAECKKQDAAQNAGGDFDE